MTHFHDEPQAFQSQQKSQHIHSQASQKRFHEQNAMWSSRKFLPRDKGDKEE